MKIGKYLLGVVLFFVVGCMPMKYSNDFVQSKYGVDFQSVIDSVYLKNLEAIGILVAVEYPEAQISWRGAVGRESKKSKKKVSANQPALLASNTKTYVSVAILRLIEDGELGLNQPIELLLSEKTRLLLQKDQYDLKAITLVHLLSHTSGIADYVDEAYMNQITQAPSHRWTRDEQIALAMKIADPIGAVGVEFNYADINYLLLTEILEQKTKKPFYTAIRDLLDFEAHHLQSTWFYSLEDKPRRVKPLVHQYYGHLGWDSYLVDPSFDLYGGGGLASTSRDLARFLQLLFEQKIIKDPETLHLINSQVGIDDGRGGKYYLGLGESEILGYKAFGHGGFWGTMVQYIPELNASISVFILERDKRNLRKQIIEAMIKELVKVKK